MSDTMARIPPWAFVVLFLLLVGVCSVSCAPKTPPSLFPEGPPPLPVVEHVTGDRHDNDCDVTPYDPTAPLACSGLVVPEGLVAEWYALPSEVEAWKAAAEHQRASCERDRTYAQDAYATEYEAHSQCRQDARALRWAGMGLGIGGVVLGLLVGYGVGSLP